MQNPICDLCGKPIKNTDKEFHKLFLLTVNSNDKRTIMSSIIQLLKYGELMGISEESLFPIKEICSTCKEIMERLFDVRRTDLQETLQQIKKEFHLHKKARENKGE